MKIIFWLSFAILLYVYIGYPLILIIISKFMKKHKKNENYFPSVSFIIPAHNEEEIIDKKIKNTLDLDYPGEMEIIIALDCSTDKTYEIASKYLNQTKRKIIIKKFNERKGKMATLNNTVKEIRSDVIIFTDANAMLEKNSIKKLTRNLVDEKVGCVCGVKNIVGEGNVGKYENLYWKFETLIKNKESIMGFTFADGSIYAIKREIYPFPKADQIIMDDFAVSLGTIKKNKKVVFEKEAIAYESASINLFDEFKRKIRIMEGAITAIINYFDKKVVLQVISHKILRWLTFIFMILLFGTSLFIEGIFYMIVLNLQIIFYAMAILGLVIEVTKIKFRKKVLFYFPLYFCLTTVAQIVGILKYISGKRNKPYWEITKRE